MASNLRAMASNLLAMASKTVEAMTSNLVAMASNLVALQPNSDGLQPRKHTGTGDAVVSSSTLSGLGFYPSGQHVFEAPLGRH